mgnify:CR=1 FL=1
MFHSVKWAVDWHRSRTYYTRIDRILTHKKFSWQDGGALVLLCVVSVLFYRHIALTNRILIGGDAFSYFYPYRAYAADAVVVGAKIDLVEL